MRRPGSPSAQAIQPGRRSFDRLPGCVPQPNHRQPRPGSIASALAGPAGAAATAAATTTSARGVRVGDREATIHQPLDVIDLGTLDVRGALGIDHDLDAELLL